jgi:putative membrane protein
MSPPYVWWLAAAVVALQLPYPLVHGHARNALTVATVVVFAAASVAHGRATGGGQRVAALCAVGVIGFGAEVLGVHTGVPFGDYHYTGGLGPTVASVPVLIALAWLMMAQPAACVAARLAHHRWRRVVIAAVALAGWDVFLDPQMVDAHHWRWTHPHPHLPGINTVPLSNYGGWLLVSLLVMLLLHTTQTQRFGARGGDGPMVMLWVWTWLSSTLANLAFFHRPAVALWGFVAMGVVGIPLLRTATR